VRRWRRAPGCVARAPAGAPASAPAVRVAPRAAPPRSPPHIPPQKTHRPHPTPAARQLNCAEGLPESVGEAQLAGDEAFLRAFHHALLEVHLEEGSLVCPETGRRFKVAKGVPNMLLNEDEV
jgi:uncharacterized protein YbaR (Trm112 family)